jgi:hypothetical protein
MNCSFARSIRRKVVSLLEAFLTVVVVFIAAVALALALDWITGD